MSYIKIIPWILIIVGAIINFVVPIILKKKTETTNEATDKIYITKSAGLVMVIIGCIMIFWLGGKFGV